MVLSTALSSGIQNAMRQLLEDSESYNVSGSVERLGGCLSMIQTHMGTLSLTHTHTQRHTLSISHTQARSQTHKLSFLHTHTHKHILSHTHKLTR